METSLIGPENAQGFPAPYWFLVLFKVLGMVLHMVPMHLWFAGLIVMLLLRRRGGEHAARLSDRTLNALRARGASGDATQAEPGAEPGSAPARGEIMGPAE